MKHLSVLALLAALCWTTSEAWAQFGLYGSPGMVRLPPVELQASGESEYPGRLAASRDPTEMPPVASAWDLGPASSEATALSPGLDAGYDGQLVPAYPSPPIQTAAVKPGLLPPESDAAQIRQPGGDPPSVVDQMLSESGSDFPPPWGPDPGGEGGAGLGGDAGCDCGGACRFGRFGRAIGNADCSGSCLTCFQPKWYVTASGLVMARGDRANKVWVTYDFTTPEDQLLHTWKDMEWRGGGEIRFGRRFGCGAWAIEVAYWTLDPFTSMASCTAPPPLATPLEFEAVIYAAIPGFPGDLFNDAEEHRVWRRDEVHNVELSLVRDQVESMCFGPFDCGWSVGARFFRFEEDLTFGSRDSGTTDWTSDLDAVGYLEDHIQNNLAGVQLAYDVEYRVGNWQLFLAPKVGVYNNHIRHRFRAYRGDGELFAPDVPSYPPYPVSSTRDVTSFLTEIDVGLEWQFAARWRATVGYRATIATGVGLADHQIPPYVVDTPELADVDYNGYLLLHGGFAGLTYTF